MTLGEIFAVLLISMLIFLPFVILFSPKVKNKLVIKNKQKNNEKETVKKQKEIVAEQKDDIDLK